MFKAKLTAVDNAVLNANFDTGSIVRGRSYYKSGKVQRIKIFDNGRCIASCVGGQGGNVYETNIRLLEDQDVEGISIEGQCSCYVGFNCKHVVATLFEAETRGSHSLLVAHSSQPTSAAFDRWLNDFQSMPDSRRDTKSETQNSHHLVYVLQPEKYDSKALEVNLKISKLLKKGGYGKPKKYSPTAYSQQAYLALIDEEIISGLQFINRSTGSSSYSDYCLKLEGHQSSKWLETILKTERAFWLGIDSPLMMGETKRLEFKWELLDDAHQTLQLSIDGSPIQIFLLDQLWYLDKTKGQCAPLDTDVPVNILKKLIDAPPIPPTMIGKTIQQIKSVIPHHEQLLPTQLGKPIVKINVEPIPEISLNMESISLQDKSSRYYYSLPAVEVATAEISFDYEGKMIPFSLENTAETITYAENGTVYSVKRNFEKEKAYLFELDEHMQLEELKTKSAGNKPTKLLISSLQDEEDILSFVMHTLPQLEYNGWRIIRKHPYFAVVVQEEDHSWYSELDEESEYDYFSFKMGIVIEDEKINLLPIIADIMKSTNAEDFKDFQDDQAIPLALPGGKILSVPYSRIKPILSILLELYDAEFDGTDAMKLSKRQAALLFEIEKAFEASKLRWFGGEKLRKLGKKLSDFKFIKKVSPPKTFKATLRDYQQEGVDWLQFLREYQMGGILADDMGLGKTVQTLAHLSIEKNKRRMKKPSLIIAPTSLMVNWRLEAERFTPNLKVLVYHGDDRHCYQDSIPTYDIMLTTYPLLVRDKKLLLSHEFYYLILDEAQFIKNHKAKSTQIVHQLKAEHRLCVTGTPMENHLGELWSLFHFLMPGFLGDSRRFKTLFRTPIEKNNDEDRRKGLAARIKPFMLRRRKSEVLKELPPKTEIIRQVELQGPQRDLYESIRLSMEKKVRDAVKKQGLARSHIIILDALLKLRQTCCHPQLLKLPAAKKAHPYSAKMTLLQEMLPKMVAEGRKILLFSQFTGMLKIIETALKAEKLDYVKLTGSTKNRAKPIESFQQGKVPIFLISLKAGGTGLNLTAADTVIHYDPWWNPAVEDQATDRSHRIGQKKSVFVYKLLASGTVEETIQEMQQKKRQLMEGLLCEENSGKAKLSIEDLASLFKPLAGS